MKQKLVLCLLAIAMGIIQCSPVKPALTGDRWNDHEEHAVKGRNGILIKQKLSFAEYQTSTVKRSWTQGSSSNAGVGLGVPGTPDYTQVIGLEYVDKRQTLRFSMDDPAGIHSDVFCVSKFSSKDLYLGKNQNSIFNIGIDLMRLSGDYSSSLYYVQIYLPHQPAPWQIVLDNEQSQAKPSKYIGYLTQSRDKYYKIVPLNQVLDKNGVARKMPFGSLGFQFLTADDRPIAAVSLMDNGKVYFNKSASREERFLIANACAALLLQEVIG